MSVFFFDYVDAPNHLAGPPDDERIPEEVLGRALVVQRLEMMPVECVARGYLTGSGIIDYRATGQVCGIELPDGLTEASKFAEPLFTPATKAELGEHDENISFDDVVDLVGAERAAQLRDLHAADLHSGRRPRAEQGNHHRRHQVRVRGRRDRRAGAGRRGVHPRLVAVLARRRLPGGRRAAELRQAVRPQLADRARNPAGTAHGDAPPPPLPPDIVEATRARYIEAYERISGLKFADWIGAR